MSFSLRLLYLKLILNYIKAFEANSLLFKMLISSRCSFKFILVLGDGKLFEDFSAEKQILND